MNQKQSPVVTIPLYFYWDTDEDTFDGSHPNSIGQKKIAKLVFDTIINLEKSIVEN